MAEKVRERAEMMLPQESKDELNQLLLFLSGMSQEEMKMLLVFLHGTKFGQAIAT